MFCAVTRPDHCQSHDPKKFEPILGPLARIYVRIENTLKIAEKRRTVMQIRTNVKAGGQSLNHNQTMLRESAKGLRVKTSLKAGGQTINHNQTMLRVKGGVKAGGISNNHNQTLLRANA